MLEKWVDSFFMKFFFFDILFDTWNAWQVEWEKGHLLHPRKSPRKSNYQYIILSSRIHSCKSIPLLLLLLLLPLRSFSLIQYSFRSEQTWTISNPFSYGLLLSWSIRWLKHIHLGVLIGRKIVIHYCRSSIFFPDILSLFQLYQTDLMI